MWLKCFSIPKGTALKGKNSLPLAANSFSLLELILSFKRSFHFEGNAIEENHCLFQQSPLDVRNFFSVLATPLHMQCYFRARKRRTGAHETPTLGILSMEVA